MTRNTILLKNRRKESRQHMSTTKPNKIEETNLIYWVLINTRFKYNFNYKNIYSPYIHSANFFLRAFYAIDLLLQ